MISVEKFVAIHLRAKIFILILTDVQSVWCSSCNFTFFVSFPDCVDTPTENLMEDAYMVIIATVVLIFALVILRMSYVSNGTCLHTHIITLEEFPQQLWQFL